MCVALMLKEKHSGVLITALYCAAHISPQFLEKASRTEKPHDEIEAITATRRF